MTIINTPDGDTNTLGLVQATLDDISEVSALLGNLGGIRWQGHTDVQLGDGNVETGSSKSVECTANVWNGTVANNQVALSANTVDRGTTADETVSQCDEIGKLATRVVQVVVVEVQLGCWVNSGGGFEGEINELFTEQTIEDGVTEGSVVLEDLVDDIPMVDLALKLGHDGCDVVNHDRPQSSSIVDVRDPGWELAVPDKSVASDLLAIGLSIVDQVVTTGQGENPLRLLSRVPFHGVFWCQRTKLGLDNGINLGNTEGVLVRTGTEILLALRLNLCVQGAGSGS